MTLEPLHTVTEVAEALRVTEHFVKVQCRRREWPHRRPNRNTLAFTGADFARILELTATPVETDEPVGLAFAPRSRRAS